MNHSIGKVQGVSLADHGVPPSQACRALDDYLFEHRSIPTEIAGYAKAKLGPNANIHPPRRNASYKGVILLNTPDWLIQAIGRNGGTAIIHRKADVALIGSLQARDRAERLIGVSAQVHYNGDRAKAYPLNAERLPATARHEVSRCALGPER